MRFFKKFLFEKSHPGIQLLKYSVCGGMAFATDLVVFYLLAVFFFPALTSDDGFVRLFHLDVASMATELRLHNFWICKSISFCICNIVAYFLNVLFVFTGGKHKVHHEVVLFFGLAFIAFLLGAGSGDLLIRFFGVQTSISNFTAIIFATLINYAGRKFLIFRG